ncbi:MAG TPA: hypothetical protein PKU80_04755 [Candidatus Limiplasma sp.]|nr:hypothetical protein [Candidatus Limiplasma sp.]HRX07554.1 hypothetical protein [Candidatus Limiplasma sp.]
MKIIAIEKELQSISGGSAAALYKAEARQVYALYLQGALREIYLTEQHCAIIILECTGLEEAKLLLATLPLVQSGVITFDVHELRPYMGYGRLMKE